MNVTKTKNKKIKKKKSLIQSSHIGLEKENSKMVQ